jgi:hypothetical protein
VYIVCHGMAMLSTNTCKFAHTCQTLVWWYWTEIACDREDTRRLHDYFAFTHKGGLASSGPALAAFVRWGHFLRTIRL